MEIKKNERRGEKKERIRRETDHRKKGQNWQEQHEISVDKGGEGSRLNNGAKGD